MLHTVYTRQDVAEICYLYEMLLWVALRRVPLAYISDYGVDWRELDKVLDGLDPTVNFPLVSHAECARAGLPPNPGWDEFLPSDAIDAEDICRSLRNPNIPNPYREEWEGRLQKPEVFFQLQKNWDAEFDFFVDRHRSRLFLALSDGRIEAKGRRLPKPTYRASVNHYKRSRWTPSNVDWEPIPPNFWNSRGIQWLQCAADGKGTAYGLILIRCDQLFACFPPQPEKADGIIRIGEVLAPSSQGKTRRPTGQTVGRPPYDWDSFHIEVARRLLMANGELPDKQEAFIAEMQNWCAKNWSKEPSRAAVFEKVKPYYDAFARKVRKSRG
jgi:hypothetical protein